MLKDVVYQDTVVLIKFYYKCINCSVGYIKDNFQSRCWKEVSTIFLHHDYLLIEEWCIIY